MLARNGMLDDLDGTETLRSDSSPQMETCIHVPCLPHLAEPCQINQVETRESGKGESLANTSRGQCKMTETCSAARLQCTATTV